MFDFYKHAAISMQCFQLHKCIFVIVGDNDYYYPYRAFGVFHALCDKEGNNIIIARAIIWSLPGLYVTYHFPLIYFYDLS